MKKFLTRSRKRQIYGFLLCGFIILCSVPVYASTNGTNLITNGFANLQSLVTGFVSSIGSIIVLWGLFEWGNSMQAQDGMMQTMAFRRIGGGLVMTLGPQLLPILLPSA